MKLPTNKILVFDIECDSTDHTTANMRYFGAYSYITNKRYFYKSNEIDSIKELFDVHDIFVSFNGKRYDMPILNRYDIFLTAGKVHVDLWEVLSETKLDPKTHTRTGGKGRGQYLGLKLNSWSLANIVKALSLGEYKDEGFDYSILKKHEKEWTNEELTIVTTYLNQDITITKRLFEFTNNFFHPFTEYLSENNIRRLTYMTASIASLAYKIVCFKANLPEEYGEEEKDWDYEGGYVIEPTEDEYNDVLIFDFNSLYPSIFRSFNLFSPAPDDYPVDKVFTGNDFFKVTGRYKNDEQGVIEGVIEQLYADRKEYQKKGDQREYLIKIIINSLYGISCKPVFQSIFYRYCAEDCTAIGRTMLKHVEKTFVERGFKLIAGDTDSIFIGLNNKSKADAIALSQELVAFFKTKMTFPNDDFGFKLDAEIKKIFFFRFEDGTVKKKNYIYITTKDKLKIKGLPIIKSDASRVAAYVLDTYLRAEIVKKQKVKFRYDYLQQLVYFALEKDITLAAKIFKVRDADYYRVPSALHAQIARTYGPGVHELIPNSRYGVGKDKKYCTIQEFNEKHMAIHDIDLSGTWNNLEPFIKNEQTNLMGWDDAS